MQEAAMRIARSTRSHTVTCVLGIAVALVVNCGGNDNKPERTTFSGSGGSQQAGGSAGASGTLGSGGSGPSYSAGGTSGGFNLPDTGPAAGSGGVQDSGYGIPDGTVFVQANTGRYALGAEITGAGVANTGVTLKDQACNTIAGVVRDFKGNDEVGGHPDFETCIGSSATTGMVEPNLGSDGKPVYVPKCEVGVTDKTICPNGQEQSTKANFDQWYRATDGVNRPFLIYLEFAQNGNVMTFESNSFFPLDNAGFGNNGRAHNYHFTTEVHTKFKYAGGETFTFKGDDDVWIFINGKLAMDLGGSHSQVTQTLNLDASAATFGITPGNEYNFDMFHAERHTPSSNFRVDTTLAFTDCGSIPPDIK
jgi:fibro-slime domain-containing protein